MAGRRGRTARPDGRAAPAEGHQQARPGLHQPGAVAAGRTCESTRPAFGPVSAQIREPNAWETARQPDEQAANPLTLISQVTRIGWDARPGYIRAARGLASPSG